MYILLGICSLGILGNYSMCIYSTFVILIFYMILKRKIIYPRNKNFYIIMLFSISYTIISYMVNKSFSYFILFAPTVSYYCGCIIYEFCKNDEEYISKCVISIAVGFFLHAMLNYSINIGSISRNTIDFWTRTYFSATLQATMLTMILSMFFWGIFYIKKLHEKILYVICFILALLYITVIASRTPIIISIIVFFINIILDNIFKKKFENCIKIFSILLILSVSIYILYSNNIFGIKGNIEKSNIMQRFFEKETKFSDENRIDTLILAFKSILENPMGNEGNIGNLRYAHNMWLDVWKTNGIIPFILLIIYTINTFVSLLYLLKKSSLSIKYKILINSIYIGVNINFMTEPIMQGVPFYFVIFIVINGMIDSQYIKLKSGVKENENSLDS